MKTRISHAGLIVGMLAILIPVGAAAGSSWGHWDLEFGDWGDAEPVADTDNSVQGGCPFESPNGRYLYMATARPGGAGGLDIWRARRQSWSLNSAFGAAENLPWPVNSEADDFCPTAVLGNFLFFVSRRGGEGSCGGGDIYLTHATWRQGWRTPIHLGCESDGSGPNTAGEEFSPSFVVTRAGVYLYFSSTASGNHDIYVSELGLDGRFSPGVPVDALNSTFDDRMPNISPDGLEVVFSSNRAGEGNQDVYTASRDHVDDDWSEPELLGPGINTAGDETRASMSMDRKRLYFGRGGEIYVSERKVRKKWQKSKFGFRR